MKKDDCIVRTGSSSSGTKNIKYIRKRGLHSSCVDNVGFWNFQKSEFAENMHNLRKVLWRTSLKKITL